MTTYEEIMELQCSSSTSRSMNGGNGGGGDITIGELSSISKKNAVNSLSKRLVTFRKWLTNEANVTIHPAVCIVNGEATDGTRNAPVLIVEKPGTDNAMTTNNLNGSNNSGSALNGKDKLLLPPTVSAVSKTNIIDNTATGGRIGTIDGDTDIEFYDRTMGCCVRVTRELKINEVVMSMPRSAMITPDLVASSDAGRAVLGCCKLTKSNIEDITRNYNNNSSNGSSYNSHRNLGFWEAFENTTICETKFSQKIIKMSGPQVLVKILQERKKAEGAFKKSTENGTNNEQQYRLADYGIISTRAPFLAFLIHQRFSNTVQPKVASYDTTASLYTQDLDDFDNDENEFQAVRDSDDENALSVIDTHGGMMISVPPQAPETFAPYARTLPSSVSIPLCWKRNELALLANCIPGAPLLQDVATRTSQLAVEYISLLDAGITTRFPKTFPDGLLTWDRWVWAASVFTSRLLPASCYFNAGDDKAADFHPLNTQDLQSPAHVWDELGVLIPLLDMLNHEITDNQITWQQCAATVPSTSDVNNVNGIEEITENLSSTLGRAIIHKKVKKGSELYTCYGHESTSNLILRYGFAQLHSSFDEVRMGWALPDAVGNVSSPTEYLPDFEVHTDFVFESSAEHAITSWWTSDRLALLENNAFAGTDTTFRSELRAGKKVTVAAHGDGTLHPTLLAATVIATMPESYVKKFANQNDSNSKIILSKRHQQIIQRYLQFSFTRKLEKLLQNLDNGLKDQYGNIHLWTKASEGGLRYMSNVSSGENKNRIGWQTFFDTHAYKATMEVENHYYAMGSDSCVLALYDGQLRALQTSFDTVSDNDNFATNVLQQLRDLDFEVSDGELDLSDVEKSNTLNGNNEKMDDDEKSEVNHSLPTEKSTNDTGDKSCNEIATAPNENSKSNSANKSSRKRKRNKKKSLGMDTANTSASGQKPPTIKLHVGNLSYSTTPSKLYDYFASAFGQDNVLECTIPIERESGKSRGFGFVTLPEAIAMRALHGSSKYEVEGRLLKIAKSVSVGSETKPPEVPPVSSSGRCSKCGYTPKYCTCAAPSLPHFNRGIIPRGNPMPPPMHPHLQGPPPSHHHHHVPPPPPPHHHQPPLQVRPYGPPFGFGMDQPRGDFRGYYDIPQDRYMNGGRRDFFEGDKRPPNFERDRQYDHRYGDDYYGGRRDIEVSAYRDANVRNRDHNRDLSSESLHSSTGRDYDSNRGSHGRDESRQSSRRSGGRHDEDEQAGASGNRKRSMDSKDRNKKRKRKRQAKSPSRSASPT